MAEKLYTLLDANDYVLYASRFEEGQQPSNAVPELVTAFMVKPRFIRASRTYQETATPQEISIKKAELNPPTQQFWVDEGDGTMRKVSLTNGVLTASDPV